jgi:arginine deiminase
MKTAVTILAKPREVETFGVQSEVGRLRLFDDVLWVQEAQRDHFDFVLKMRERGVEVLDLHDLLAETLEIPEARAWLDQLPAIILAEHLIGGIAILDLHAGTTVSSAESGILYVA